MRVILSGGGTGGHIYPALAIAEHCFRELPDSEILYIGTEKGLEKQIVSKTGIPFEAIEITGFKRKLSIDNVKTIIRFFRAVQRSKALIQRFQPDVVVGTGGYVCGPVLYAAAKSGIPTIIHEQNVIPGLTNRFLAKMVDTVAVSFEGSEIHFAKAKRVIVTGNPRATAVVHADRQQGWKSLHLPSGSQVVVVVGGSRGAKAINEAMIEMVPLLHQLNQIHFVYVTGDAYFQDTMQRIQSNHKTLPGNLHIFPYIHHMPDVLAASSLVVNRSGASFLAEITALGLPSILIPSPNVTNNHQEANARILADQGAAELILERDLNGKVLFSTIQKVMSDPVRFQDMAQQSRKLGKPDAANMIFAEMLQLCKIKS